MARYCTTIFLSAFLLFQVQPLIGKYVLPWFGGTPAVWTTCLLFFQLLLVLGYGYAHGIALRLRPRTQFWVHLLLMAATLAVLPIGPAAMWKPVEQSSPTCQILLILLVSVGAPYLVLSSTAPLLQSWFCRTHPQRSPYRLYALSNAGSLLGLFAYPFLVEPLLPLEAQTYLWSGAYVLFIVLCALCARDLWKLDQVATRADSAGTEAAGGGGAGRRQEPVAANPEVGTMGFWLALSACGSLMLLATTNLMCQDVACVPFLWVLPLGLYLLSFIVLFGCEHWYSRKWSAPAVLAAILAAWWLAWQPNSLNLTVQIGLYSFILTVCCFACHGELVQLKPASRYLTLYYVVIAVGGALGGGLVALVAPRVFPGYYEFHVGLVACVALLLLLARRDRWLGLAPAQVRKQVWVTAGGALVVTAITPFSMWGLSNAAAARRGATVLARERSFFGSLNVMRRGGELEQTRRVTMSHGSTMHGFQFEREELRGLPTLYYAPESGIGTAIRQHPRFARPHQPLRLGVVGLGTGTLCCYARPGDTVHFYEIDPLVVQLSRKYFTFQDDALRRGVDVKVDVGDARIVLERQLARQGSQEFDVLAVDAFSSDAIPLHLLTKECFDLYFRHLRREGIVAVHISNRHLDLRAAVRNVCRPRGYRAIWVCSRPDAERLRRGLDAVSQWVLVTRNEEFLADDVVRRRSEPWPEDLSTIQLTDDFGSLFQLLRW